MGEVVWETLQPFYLPGEQDPPRATSAGGFSLCGAGLGRERAVSGGVRGTYYLHGPAEQERDFSGPG